MARSHVYAIIAAFERDGFEGLEDQRTRPSPHPDDQLTLPLLKEVLDLQQEYPRAGRFRIHGLLESQYGADLPSEATVGRAMAINRRVHGAPGPWSSARDEHEHATDHGAVFQAHDYVAILNALEIEPKYIELRKPWQNLIEAQFKVQLRLADFKFEQASTVDEIQRLHAAF